MFNDFLQELKKRECPHPKKMVKRGTLAVGVVESTPVVWQDRLLRFEWIRSDAWAEGNHAKRDVGYYHFVDMETNKEVGNPFAFGNAFGCAYEENGVMYAHGVGGNGAPCNYIDVYWSKDLCEWQTQRAITLPDEFNIYNTSVCKDDKGYVMTIEISGPKDVVGEPFTIVFARSTDLLNWELLPMDTYLFYKEAYSACPSIRYVDGMYYMVYLELLPFYRCAPYIVRSADLITFEVALLNPFMLFSDEDRTLVNPDWFTDEQKEMIRTAMDNNNSDVDFCEYKGKTYILYSWGNQLGKEFLGLAEYDGPLNEFLKSFF